MCILPWRHTLDNFAFDRLFRRCYVHHSLSGVAPLLGTANAITLRLLFTVGTEDISTSGSSLLLVFDLCGCILICLQDRRHPWENSKIPSTLSSSSTPGSAGNPLGTLP